MNRKNEVTIYSDGSADPNPGAGGWAALLTCEDRVLLMVGQEERATSNQMELVAVLRGLERLKFPCHVTIVTDSQYVVNGFNRIFNGKPLLNTHESLWERVREQYQRHLKVVVMFVKGHSKDTPSRHRVVDSFAWMASRGKMSPMEKYASAAEIESWHRVYGRT